MWREPWIELGRGRSRVCIPIVHEDRQCLVMDKPAGWLLAPAHWNRTSRNLTAALMAAIQAGAPWARARQLKFLRFVHRLDAETTGLVLMVKQRALVDAYTHLFEHRLVHKVYLAVVNRPPPQPEWVATQKIAPVPGRPGLMRVDEKRGKPAETHFRVLAGHPHLTLVEARPLTGRTHQIRLHLAAAGCPVTGDELYGGQPPTPAARERFPLALRATHLAFEQPHTRQPVRVTADTKAFLAAFGFASFAWQPPPPP
ncbi:MAG: RluA family pseudouridine synthase [Verrucomicrobiae bacterium]|nr:RluA family pseudouridine synthase [Verrucomicrobiae bacterium]